jgi:uncharacterized tellurite resistance protein B-like protein
MELRDKITICKVVAQAILSDAEITDAEHAFLDKLLVRYGLNKEQRHDVMHRNIGDDPAELVGKLGDEKARKTLLRTLAQAVAADGVFSAGEEKLVARVGEKLGIAPAEIEKLVAEAVR